MHNTAHAEEIKGNNFVLVMAMVTAFVTTFTSSAINLSVPNIGMEFGASAALVGWVVTGYTVSTAALSIPMGKIADVKGRRRILLTGVSSFAVISLICIFATSIWFLIAARIAQGMAASMIFSTSNAILISSFPASQRGRVLGISVAATYTGLSAGPVIGGVLNAYLGWRSIFIVTCLVAATSIVMIIKGVPKEKKPEGRHVIDMPGNLLLIAMMVLLLYGFSNLTVLKYGWVILAGGVVAGILFVIREMRAEDPVVRISMFSQDAVFTMSNLAALLNYGATFAISYLVSIYLQLVMGLGSQMAGLVLIIMPAVQAVFSPVMGRLSDRHPPYKLASTGMALCVVGLIMFSFISVNTHVVYIYLALAVEGLGFALFSSPNTNAVMSRVKPQELAVANSILATMRTFGHSTSMAIVTIVVGVMMGSQGLSEASPDVLVSTIHRVFIIFIVLCIAGVFLSLGRGKVGSDK